MSGQVRIPDSVSRLIELDTHDAVFPRILERFADAPLIKGKRSALRPPTLEAKAEPRGIVRCNTLIRR